MVVAVLLAAVGPTRLTMANSDVAIHSFPDA
jgi:hypothetical protein